VPALLTRLGLHRPELRAWAAYDWANSAFVTTVVTAVFPIYFSAVAAADLPPAVATTRFALATTIALVLVAIVSPLLGAIADVVPVKKKLLAGFLSLGVAATASLALVGRGDWVLGAVLFALGNVGLNGSYVFYDALLPHVARGDELDRVSTAGYALGYVGGGILLALNLAMIQQPAWFGLASADPTLPSRLAFLSVAAWWALFSLPLFRRVPEPAIAGRVPASVAVREGLARLARTLRELRALPQAGVMLLAFLVYNDGIGTIIRMAAIYGTEIGIGRTELIAAILLVQFVGIPFAFVFGALAGRVGAKRAIFVGLAIYCAIAMVGYFMRTATHFFVLAALVAIVQGGTQALSRSLFASLVPRDRSGEFFGFFSVTEKVAGILGPAVFAATGAATGSSRTAVLAVIAFFVVGALLLARVDVEAGRRAARAAESPAQPALRSGGAGTPST
jgi:UMF1 family MFS transporter